MNTWWMQVRSNLETERGATMVEYSLVVVLIGIVSLLVVGALGVDVFGSMDTAQQSFDGPAPAVPTP